MSVTEYLFCEWTDVVDESDLGMIRVIERIRIGEDFWNNFAWLTKVEIFSSCFKPTSMKIKGDRIVGILAENRQGEYFFYALFEDVSLGEVREIKVWLEGQYTTRHLFPEGAGRYTYKSNFAWVGPHLQRLFFPKGYEILSVQPEGGMLGWYRGRPTVTWRRASEFWGGIEVKLRRER